MAKCVICGKDAVGLSRYCSGACRAKKARRTVERTRTVDNEAHAPERTDLEKCQYCGNSLPRLMEPRQYPGACLDCALKQPAKTYDEPVCGLTLELQKRVAMFKPQSHNSMKVGYVPPKASHD